MRYSLKCHSSWRRLDSSGNINHTEYPVRRDGQGLGEEERFRAHDTESRMEHPAFVKHY